MKKIVQLFIFNILLLLASCSNSNDNSSIVNPPSNSIKRISETRYINGQTSFSADFNYENGILKSISDATHRIELTYTGSKISSSIIYTNNVIANSYSFDYNTDLLETISNTTNNYERTLYSYNNGILTSEKNQSLIDTNWQTEHTYNYEFLNGNILTHYEFFQNSTPSKFSHEYDTKLNPMHYMNPTVRSIVGLESCNFKNTNNEIKQYKYTTSTSTAPILDITYQITYNTQNLPITIKKYDTNNILISEATFEYN